MLQIGLYTLYSSDMCPFPLLVIDIGNTSTVLGLANDTYELQHNWRVRTKRDLLPDDLARQLYSLFSMSKAEFPRAAVLSSVAPPVGENYVIALQKYFDIETLSVQADQLPDVQLELETNTNLGADRLCNLFGVERYLGTDPSSHSTYQFAVVVDFGTSTNFDIVGTGRRFLGGVLATGAQISADALFAHAAQLPRINLEAPQSVIGKSTKHALQSGLVFGYAEMVDGIIRRIKTELAGPTVTVATGGFAQTIKHICHEIDYYDELLTLNGLLQIWKTRT